MKPDGEILESWMVAVLAWNGQWLIGHDDPGAERNPLTINLWSHSSALMITGRRREDGKDGGDSCGCGGGGWLWLWLWCR